MLYSVFYHIGVCLTVTNGVTVNGCITIEITICYNLIAIKVI